MCVFTLERGLTQEPVIVPIDSTETESIYNMLNSAFPYSRDTCHLGFWDFHICCWDGYDNGIIFH